MERQGVPINMIVCVSEIRPKSERVRATPRRAERDQDFGEGIEVKTTSLRLQRPHVHGAWGHHPHPHLTGPDPSAAAVSAAV